MARGYPLKVMVFCCCSICCATGIPVHERGKLPARLRFTLAKLRRCFPRVKGMGQTGNIFQGKLGVGGSLPDEPGYRLRHNATLLGASAAFHKHEQVQLLGG